MAICVRGNKVRSFICSFLFHSASLEDKASVKTMGLSSRHSRSLMSLSDTAEAQTWESEQIIGASKRIADNDRKDDCQSLLVAVHELQDSQAVGTDKTENSDDRTRPNVCHFATRHGIDAQKNAGSCIGRLLAEVTVPLRTTCPVRAEHLEMKVTCRWGVGTASSAAAEITAGSTLTPPPSVPTVDIKYTGPVCIPYCDGSIETEPGRVRSRTRRDQR